MLRAALFAFIALPNPLLLLEVPLGDTEDIIDVRSIVVGPVIVTSGDVVPSGNVMAGIFVVISEKLGIFTGFASGIFISFALATTSPVAESSSLFGIASQGSKEANDNGSLIALVTRSIYS